MLRLVGCDLIAEVRDSQKCGHNRYSWSCITSSHLKYLTPYYIIMRVSDSTEKGLMM